MITKRFTNQIRKAEMVLDVSWEKLLPRLKEIFHLGNELDVIALDATQESLILHVTEHVKEVKDPDLQTDKKY